MEKIQLILNFCRKPRFILFLILSVFLLKGIFLAELYPALTGQDEARHYNTIQFISSPRVPVAQRIKRTEKNKDKLIEKYNFSQEITHSGQSIGLNDIRKGIYNTNTFIAGYNGGNETAVNSSHWKPLNYYYSPDIATPTLYHTLASFIEKYFATSNILVRFYLIRIFSVLLGTLAVFLTYFIAKNSGFSQKNSLLLTAIVAFQPKFTMYFTNINYDVLLIPMFFLFTLSGVLILKNGLRWKNFSLLVLSVIIAMQAKGTGVILLGMSIFLIGYVIFTWLPQKNKLILRGFYALTFLAIIFLFNYFRKYLPLGGDLPSILQSLSKYMDKSLTMGRFAHSSRTYWGALTWVNNFFLQKTPEIVRWLEIFSAFGLIIFLFSKKKFSSLPKKKFVIFFLAMIIALQLGIRSYDWNTFAHSGSLVLGTPGRYFLPNLASHLILFFVGLGTLFEIFKKKNPLEYSLVIGFITMFSFCFYIIFNVIILRFYL